jgi:hypothetical protein
MIVHEAQRVVGDGSVWRPCTIEQGADGAADLVAPPRALFGESGILADDEARWRTAPLPQRCASRKLLLSRAVSI